MKKPNALFGIVLIFFGSILLADQIYDIDFFNFYNFWPLFILVPGILLEISFFSLKKDPAILVLGGIFTTTGLLFIFETSTNWKYSTETWPIYTLGLAIGLFQYYLFSKKKNSLLTVIFLLAFVSIFSFAINFLGDVYTWLTYGLLLPCLIIIIGIYVLLKNIFSKNI
ncbi:LiaF transmembrane domain-containing protein [Clostridium sp.]